MKQSSSFKIFLLSMGLIISPTLSHAFYLEEEDNNFNAAKTIQELPQLNVEDFLDSQQSDQPSLSWSGNISANDYTHILNTYHTLSDDDLDNNGLERESSQWFKDKVIILPLNLLNSFSLNFADWDSNNYNMLPNIITYRIDKYGLIADYLHTQNKLFPQEVSIDDDNAIKKRSYTNAERNNQIMKINYYLQKRNPNDRKGKYYSLSGVAKRVGIDLKTLKMRIKENSELQKIIEKTSFERKTIKR